MSTLKWKKIIKIKTKEAALKYLTEENIKKDKTKHIFFADLKRSKYLLNNKSTSLSKTIFSVRSKTLDIKQWQPWKYKNDLCVMCEQFSETIEHFLSCPKYGPALETDWRQIDENNAEKQVEIRIFIKKKTDINRDK